MCFIFSKVLVRGKITKIPVRCDNEPEKANAVSRVEVPFGVDLRVHFDWHVSNRVTLFAEGRNLINRKLYEYLWYPELGAHFTAGVKLNF